MAFADLATVAGDAPGALAVLHLAFAWLPVAFVLYAAPDVVYATSGHLIPRPRAAACAGDRFLRLDAWWPW